LPDGTILDQLTTLRKDNTGWPFSETTPFVVSYVLLAFRLRFKAALYWRRRDARSNYWCFHFNTTGTSSLEQCNNVILALPSFDNVLPLYEVVKRQLSEILSAFEFIDRTAYDLAVKHGQGRALSEDDVAGAECFVLVETSGGRREHDEEVSFSSRVTCYDANTLGGPETGRPIGKFT
jgi:hypothetical protein